MNKDNPSQRADRELGMERNIPRRDFLNGATMTIGAALWPGGLGANAAKSDEIQNHAGYNPPVATGLRGSHSGSFEIAHTCVMERFGKTPPLPNCWLKNTI